MQRYDRIKPLWLDGHEYISAGTKELTLIPDFPDCTPPSCVPLGPAHTVGLGDAAAFTHIFQNADIVSYVESLAPSLKNVDLDEVRQPQVCWSHQWDNAECQVDTEHPHVAGVNSDLAQYVWGDAYNGDSDEGATYWHQLRYVRCHDRFEVTNYTEPH